MRPFVLQFLLLYCSFCFLALRAEIQIPSISGGPVVDQAGLLSSAEEQRLEDRIRSFMPRVQMQVWTIESLEGESIEGLSIRALDQWKLGTEKDDNGVLVLVAKSERQARIEVGQGLEGFIPDITAGRIIDYILIPSFREGQFYSGLDLAAGEIFALAGGELRKIESRPTKKNLPYPFFMFGVLMLLSFFINLFDRKGRRARGRGYYYYSLGGGFGGGGFGSGGGWSGGGGGFSGGGASGSW